ncbi:MAG: 16S rRNA (cytosine(1402)-N(4))-methyltransferase RsmH [candidate division WOR-3 bacterium]|nr:16S rRNA (cytosine(1402)-N(4))-methyltransferase RsmH [candidate division WOR-3 bacterium]MDW8113367.1 16S rRNA (cytosine(1402)-N(4))-methyltransferase RsmH [candidate division WOR-3 bacterium]
MRVLLKSYTKMGRFVEENFHIPVMLREIVDFFFLNPQELTNKYFPKKKVTFVIKETPEVFLDATAGGGGHLFSLINYYQQIFPKNFRKAIFIGLDIDKEAIDYLEEKRKKFGLDNLFIHWENYRNIKRLFSEVYQRKEVCRILFDLGISYYQAKSSKRGFSYDTDGVIDMRFDPIRQEKSALDVIRESNLERLKKILKEFGEEVKAEKIAKRIFQNKDKIETTNDLKKIILLTSGKRSVPRVFQALRIFVNNELENLKIGLREAFLILKNGGRLAVIAYHSLEDRIVKRFFNEWEKEGKGKILTPKPIIPSFFEIENNKSARSGKLRVFLKYEKV